MTRMIPGRIRSQGVALYEQGQLRLKTMMQVCFMRVGT